MRIFRHFIRMALRFKWALYIYDFHYILAYIISFGIVAVCFVLIYYCTAFGRDFTIAEA